MFVDEKQQGEAKTAEQANRSFSAAIRAGCLLSRPTSDVGAISWVTFSHGGCHACVLGAAFLGYTGTNDKNKYFSVTEMFLERLQSVSGGLPNGVLMDAQRLYEHGGKTREQVADWLESQGY